MEPRDETPHAHVPVVTTGHDIYAYTTWRSNGTNDWLLIYTLSGPARFGFEGGQIIAQPGDMVLIRPGTRHDYGPAVMPGRWERIYTHFHPRPEWHELLDWPEEAPGLMRLKLADPDIHQKIVARFLDQHRLASGGLPRKERFAMNALEEILLWCDTQNPRSAHARLDGRVHKAMEYLCAHLQEDIALATVAQVSGLSVSRLSYLFQQHLGLTPQQFLEQQRINRAKQLLDWTPRAVQEIAQEVGYNSPFYFSQRFKRHTGLSPRNYRRRAFR
ncbi:MAG TPA: helix-turn-helix domain-containing protein [Chthonomonadaceae bacterium]|nr:helix-turn-helix domain-containing protein [Chthonomonadaceae bacterium]